MSTSHAFPNRDNLIRELEETRRQIIELKDKLAEKESKFSALVEPWAQAVWEANAGGMTESDSETWRAYPSQALEELMKPDGWMEAVHPDDREYAGMRWHDAVESKKPFDAVFRLRRPDDTYRWTSVRAAPLLNPEAP